jgi:DNA uptake protein ComE-like DNA-binding protein
MRPGKRKAPKRHAPVQAPAPRFVDLNSATVEKIADLPGVTVPTAEAIVARRPLRGWDDLRGLPGVSEGLIKQLRTSGARIAPAVRPVTEQ